MKNLIISVGNSVFVNHLSSNKKEEQTLKEYLLCVNKIKEGCNPSEIALKIGRIKENTKKGDVSCIELQLTKEGYENIVFLYSDELGRIASEIISESLENQKFSILDHSGIESLKNFDAIAPCNGITVISDVVFGCINKLKVYDIQIETTFIKIKKQENWKKYSWGQD